MRVLLPKEKYRLDPAFGPLFFFGGPVRGGGDWQFKAANLLDSILSRRNPKLSAYITIPARYPENHPLRSRLAEIHGEPFPWQLNWERHYMQLAAETGCLIFWLPTEDPLAKRTDGRPYAMDSRGELGEWRAKLAINPKLRVVVGGDTAFPGLSHIKRNFDLALGFDFPIYPSLTETLSAAVEKCS